GMRYSPRVPDSAERDIPVSVLVATTVAPGSTAPLESFTVPRMVPVVVWAKERERGNSATYINDARINDARTRVFIKDLPSTCEECPNGSGVYVCKCLLSILING